MELAATIEASVGPEALATARQRMRRPGRTRMIKAAQIAFDGSVLDCVLLDISPNGASLYFPTPTELPDLATLRLKGGEHRTIQRRWRKGAHAGFEVVGESMPMD